MRNLRECIHDGVLPGYFQTSLYCIIIPTNTFYLSPLLLLAAPTYDYDNDNNAGGNSINEEARVIDNKRTICGAAFTHVSFGNHSSIFSKKGSTLH
jgi:hypothetical protein